MTIRSGDARTTRAPNAARRHLHQRHEIGDGERERLRIAVRPAHAEQPAELRTRAGLLLEQRSSRRRELVHVNSGDVAGEDRCAEVTRQHSLRDWTESKVVTRRGEMDGATHQPPAYRAPLRNQLPQLLRAKTVEARPESDIRRKRRLSLHPDQVLDRRGCRHVVTAKQQLSLERRAVERPPGEESRHS